MLDTSVEILEPCESTRKSPDSAKADATVDLSHKLFLIGRISETRKDIYRSGGSAISGAILRESGVYINPKECDSLIKEYACILKSDSKYAFLLTGLTATLYVAIANISLLSCGLMVVLLPLLTVFYNEIIISVRLFNFNPAKLIPSVVTDTDMLGSTAIIIASRNEPYEVAKMTFDSALALVYPSGKKEIIVVDNSDIAFADYTPWKNYVETFAVGGSAHVDGVKVLFIHRDGTAGFKPRNLDIALDVVTAEFILYLDVDSTVFEDTLLRITPIFLRDKNICFVQLQAVPTNAKGKSVLAMVQGLRNYFLRLETIFCAHSNHRLFYGHNAIWRTKTVREIGSCVEYHNNEIVVTEDLSMSFRACFKNYYGIGAWLESGEWVPESLRETEAMWLRWTVGTYQVYAKHFTKIHNLKKFSPQEFIGWLQHIGVLINYGLLPVYVTCGLIFNSTLMMSMVVFSILPEIIRGICAYYRLSLGKISPMKKLTKCYSAFLVLGTFINWVRCVGLLRYLAGKKQGWTPTGKAREGEISLIKVIADRSIFLFFGVATFLYSVFSLNSIAEGIIDCIVVALCGLYGLNCIVAVFLFGTSQMQEDTQTAVKQGDIHSYVNFFIDHKKT